MVHSNLHSNTDRTDFIKTLDVLIDAFMYEPANYVVPIAPTENQDSNKDPAYIHNNFPESLHIYLRDFAKNHSNTKFHGDTCDVSMCEGVGKGHHMFLNFEGVVRCSRCDIGCCKYCVVEVAQNNNNNDNNVKAKFCYNCYLNEKVIPGTEIKEHVPMDSMVDNLQNVGVEVHREESTDVVLAPGPI